MNHEQIDIHTYPTDQALVPAYRIAVMRAHHEQGMEVEGNMYLDGWYLSRGSPTWNWGTTRYRICRPKPEKSVRDLDRKAFYLWRSGSCIDQCYLETWLAARESLRKDFGGRVA